MSRKAVTEKIYQRVISGLANEDPFQNRFDAEADEKRKRLLKIVAPSLVGPAKINDRFLQNTLGQVGSHNKRAEVAECWSQLEAQRAGEASKVSNSEVTMKKMRPRLDDSLSLEQIAADCRSGGGSETQTAAGEAKRRMAEEKRRRNEEERIRNAAKKLEAVKKREALESMHSKNELAHQKTVWQDSDEEEDQVSLQVLKRKREVSSDSGTSDSESSSSSHSESEKARKKQKRKGKKKDKKKGKKDQKSKKKKKKKKKNKER